MIDQNELGFTEEELLESSLLEADGEEYCALESYLFDEEIIDLHEEMLEQRMLGAYEDAYAQTYQDEYSSWAF